MKNFLTGLKFVGRTILSANHPLVAHLVVTRRCNLSCAYCNEYDKVSAPVPLDAMKKRISALANLKTAMITCTGGEPLLHPEMETIIKEIRGHDIIATMITNGYLLTKDRIQKLNEAGLQHLQISIDNIEPDEVSYKSLKVLERKLKLLADHATFQVNINSVLGISDERTSDAIVVAKRAMSYGFSHSVGVLHNGSGLLNPLSAKQRAVYHEIGKISKSFIHYWNYGLFQKNLMEGKPNRWKCRAGARYLYICEDGLVHWCSQQRGYPGIPLEEYTVEDIKREFNTQKDCSLLCTLNCVHQVSFFDEWRSRQTLPDPQGALLIPIQPLKSG
ncbi:radical SAM protein [Candidatus Poribacteria bacterium]|nr:radical SAM protein [Candidatus Poribacteria bacterium]